MKPKPKSGAYAPKPKSQSSYSPVPEELPEYELVPRFFVRVAAAGY